MKIKFIVVSKDTSFKMTKDKFSSIGEDDVVDFEYVQCNVVPLPAIYNKALREERANRTYDYVALMHSDVSFNPEAFMKHLREIGEKYDIIGLCGTSIFNVSQSPLNWWTGSNPTPYAKWGCVTHGELGDQTSWFSEHSPNIMDAEVSCIDGLCIIFTKNALDSKIEFDENLGAFDFYDTDLSMQAVVNYKLKGAELNSSKKKELVGEDRGKLLPQDVGMLVTDYLVENFPHIMDYNYTAEVEETLDKIAEGEEDWKGWLGQFYPQFHQAVELRMNDGQYTHVERVLGIDPSDGQQVIAKYGQYGAYVQKGEGENRRFASLEKGQLIETVSLEEAVKLLSLPRLVGSYGGVDVVVTKGKFGPYVKYGDLNVTLSRKTDPLTVSLEECIAAIDAQKAAAPENNILREFPGEDIVIINGRYGPYIKHDGKNFRIPKGHEAENITLEDCKKFIAEGPTGSARPAFRKKRKK